MRFAGAKHEGLDEATLALVDDDHASSALGGRDKAVLALTDAFAMDPGQVPTAVVENVSEHLDDAQVVELAVAMAAFLGFSKLRIALGLVPDRMAVREVPTPDVPPDEREPA